MHGLVAVDWHVIWQQVFHPHSILFHVLWATVYISVDRGKMEAARSVGMTYGKAMRRIILPQAARVIVPPLGNEFNNMMKNTSLVYTIGVFELFAFAEQNYSQFFIADYFLAIAVWYLA